VRFAGSVLQDLTMKKWGGWVMVYLTVKVVVPVPVW
jgi:hypothetical protein